MKVYQQNIFPFQEKDFFSPIRNKIDFVKILVLSARQFLFDSEFDDIQSYSMMKLVVDKMSRLFFYTEDKYFSISFPFTVKLEDDNIKEFATYSGNVIDSKSISAIIAILESEEFKTSFSLIDFYIEPGSIESSGIFLLEEILHFEPSYIRYDFDPDNVNGELHPLNHLDINYSQYGTYKIGLEEKISHANFEDIQNIKSNCSYIKY